MIVSHLGSEETDAVHPHQSTGHTLNKTLYRSNSSILPLVTTDSIPFCLLPAFVSSFFPLPSSVPLPSSSQAISTCPFTSDVTTDHCAETEVDPQNAAAVPPALLFPACRLRIKAAGFHILTSRSTWLRNIYIFPYKYICVRTRTTLHSRKHRRYLETDARTHTHTHSETDVCTLT